MEERRGNTRCPVCQGPAHFVGRDMRCRNSLCSYNHEHRQCPRCQSKGPKATDFKSGKYQLRCSDCLNIWEEA